MMFLGPQGCGKGVQIDLLKKYLQEHTDREIVHFEMGRELRTRATADDYTGRTSDAILKAGGLIPYAISTGLFSLYMMEQVQTNEEHILIDGFPRTATQVPALDSALIEFYKRPKPTVLCINISDDEAVRRLLSRGRADDTEESIRKRLIWSHEQTLPNIEWFRGNPQYRVIDIEGERPIDVIHQDIIARLYSE